MQLRLYQTVQLFAGRPRNVHAHAELIDRFSRELFDRPYTPNLRALEARIAAAGAAYPTGVASFVRLEWSDEGEEVLVPAGVSLYAGYALRSLMPVAMPLRFDYPLTDAPTTAREAVALLAARKARQAGGEVALRIDSDGMCRSVDDAPLFGIRNRQVVAAPGMQSVERALAVRAAAAAGLELREEPIPALSLKHFDELFYADHRGITSLARVGDQPFMSLLGERIAEAMEHLFLKK